MDFAGISQEDSYASSLPEELDVLRKWPEECYVENLVGQNERRENKRLSERERVEFVAAAAHGQPGRTPPGKRVPARSRQARYRCFS